MPLENEKGSSSQGDQFSLRFLMTFIVILSVILAVCFGLPKWLSSAGLLCLSIFVFAVLAVAIIYGSGNHRVFCVGAIIPMTMLLVVTCCVVVVFVFYNSRNRPTIYVLLETIAEQLRAVSIAAWLMAIVTGSLTVVVRYVIQSRH